MEQLLSSLSIRVNEAIFLKDPDSSDLGRRIISGSIEMINDLGIENFSFGKLALHINSTEASVYRYFESKHKLLLYLMSWYWRWMEYRLVFATSNIQSPADRLEKSVVLLTEPVGHDNAHAYVDVSTLSNVVINEASKTYLTKLVDEENKYGVFAGYKQLVGRVSDMITEIDPDYKYPHMLVSTIVEGAHHQRFFQEHLPRLTDVVEGEDSVTQFYLDLVRNALRIKR